MECNSRLWVQVLDAVVYGLTIAAMVAGTVAVALLASSPTTPSP